MLRVYGYMQGQPQTYAQIIYNDPTKGPSVSQGPEILWNRKTNKIETRKISSVGGR